MRTQGIYYLFTLIVKMPEKWLSSTWGKSDKNNLRIISKPHAYLQTMTKTPVKFQRNRHKTVGRVAHKVPTTLGGQKDRHKTVEGVAHTMYTLSIHFDSKNAKK